MTFYSKPECILDLPSDILFSVFSYLPLQDLLTTRDVCVLFREVVDSPRYVALWANAPLASMWPEEDKRVVLEKAAEHGNVEAMIKLAVAYLYCEGVPECEGKGTLESVNAATATEWLLKAETCSGDIQPFSWVLIRPPWSPNGICCKACVHLKLKDLVNNGKQCEGIKRLPYIVGKTISYNEDPERDVYMDYYKAGMDNNCLFSTFEYIKSQNPEMWNLDVHHLRLLRKAASPSAALPCWDAQLALCEVYASGTYGGISEKLALGYVNQLMTRSSSLHLGKLQKGINPNMRYILVDWLFEVAEMKEFPSSTVHLAVSLVNRYLLQREVKRSQLQLLGIAAMLLAARWMGHLIITIREAAWLTDNTYKYEEVVRMMGDIMAVFRGDIRKPVLVDYVDILLKFSKASELTRNMALYLSEFSLLHAELASQKPSLQAATIVLLSTLLTEASTLNPWPEVMVCISGYSGNDLASNCLELYQKCYLDKNPVKDHRSVELKAVVYRFSDQRFMSVSKMEVLSQNELRDQLGLCQEDASLPVAMDTLTTNDCPPTVTDVLSLSSEASQSSQQITTDNSQDLTPTTSTSNTISARSQATSDHSSPTLKEPVAVTERENSYKQKKVIKSSDLSRAPLQSLENQAR